MTKSDARATVDGDRIVFDRNTVPFNVRRDCSYGDPVVWAMRRRVNAARKKADLAADASRTEGRLIARGEYVPLAK